MKLLGSYLFILLLFAPFIASSQERGLPIYSDYLTDNLFLLHPSMAGVGGEGQIRLTGRKQWFGVEDAPQLATLSVNVPLNEKVGIGGIAFTDSNGRFSQQGVYGSFAYHLRFSKRNTVLNMLSFGINFGILQEKLNGSDLVGPGIPFDPHVSGTVQKDFYFNADVGLSYLYMNYFFHFTVRNIIPQKRDIFSDYYKLDNQRQYIATTGYTFSAFNSSWSFQPSVMLYLQDATSEKTIDINGKVFYDTNFGRIWGGISYRRSFNGAKFTKSGSIESQNLQYFTPFVGITYKRFLFAYTYTYQANSVVLNNSGFHQITLGYNFGEAHHRYHCNCPAVKNGSIPYR